MSLLVQKPQFNVEQLKPGKAVHLQDISWDQFTSATKKIPYDSELKNIDADGLLVSVLPLALEVLVYNTKKNHVGTIPITADLVADQLIEITVLYGGERIE